MKKDRSALAVVLFFIAVVLTCVVTLSFANG